MGMDIGNGGRWSVVGTDEEGFRMREIGGRTDAGMTGRRGGSIEYACVFGGLLSLVMKSCWWETGSKEEKADSSRAGMAVARSWAKIAIRAGQPPKTIGFPPSSDQTDEGFN